MSHNIDQAFSVQDGIRINEELEGPFITGGSSAPTGLDLPVGTIYFQPIGTGFDLWEKFGALATDWIVKEFVANALITEFFASNAISTTTSDVFIDKINATTVDLPLGQYAIFWSLEYTNQNNNRSAAINVLFNADTIASDTQQFTTGGLYTIRSAIFLTDPISGPQTLRIQFRRVDSGTAAIRRATIGYIKVL